MAWLDELAADSIAGFCGFSLERLYSEGQKFDHYLIGGIGTGSHPPQVLRWIAFLTRGFVLVLWAAAIWVFYWIFVTA